MIERELSREFVETLAGIIGPSSAAQNMLDWEIKCGSTCRFFETSDGTFVVVKNEAIAAPLTE